LLRARRPTVASTRGACVGVTGNAPSERVVGLVFAHSLPDLHEI